MLALFQAIVDAAIDTEVLCDAVLLLAQEVTSIALPKVSEMLER